MLGGEGDDDLTGGAGADELQGDAGEDALDGGDDADEIDGGSDNDEDGRRNSQVARPVSISSILLPSLSVTW